MAGRRTLKVRVDLIVPNLKVPIPWRVGRVTFRPPGWLLAQLERDVPLSIWAAKPDSILREAKSEWSSASVVVTKDTRTPVGSEEARAAVGDAIALARLYQRACVPHQGMEYQTFGLPPELTSTVLDHWATTHRGFIGSGWTRIGAVGFEFRAAWIRNFRKRPAFAFLDAALRGPISTTGSWQQRGVSAIRALNLATPVRSPSVRIPLQAVALEALLGDDPPATPGDFPRPQAHPVSQRAAFLTCEVDGLRLPSGKSACIDIWGTSAQIDAGIAGRPRDYFLWPCSTYWGVRQVFYDRNRALHDAADNFPKDAPMRYERRVSDVILAAMDWAATTGATGILDLDAARAALPQAVFTG